MLNKKSTEHYRNYNFHKNVDQTHPLVNQGGIYYSACNGILRHTIILESLIDIKVLMRSDPFHNFIIDSYGYADVSDGTRGIGHALKLIQVSHL